MAFVKVGPEFIEKKIDLLKAIIAAKESALEVWNANRALQMLGRDVYVNRRHESIVSEAGVVPDIVKAPCRFVKREEIEALYLETKTILDIYQMFISAIDNGDFLMVDDDPDEKGHPGYQLFKKGYPAVDMLKNIVETERWE